MLCVDPKDTGATPYPFQDLVLPYNAGLRALHRYNQGHSMFQVGSTQRWNSSFTKVNPWSLEEVIASSIMQTPMQGYREHEESGEQ